MLEAGPCDLQLYSLVLLVFAPWHFAAVCFPVVSWLKGYKTAVRACLGAGPITMPNGGGGYYGYDEPENPESTGQLECENSEVFTSKKSVSINNKKCLNTAASEKQLEAQRGQRWQRLHCRSCTRSRLRQKCQRWQRLWCEPWVLFIVFCAIFC